MLCSEHSNELFGTELREFSKILGVTSKFWASEMWYEASSVMKACKYSDTSANE